MSNLQTQSWLIDRRHALRAMGSTLTSLDLSFNGRISSGSFLASHWPRQEPTFCSEKRRLALRLAWSATGAADVCCTGKG